MVVAVFVVSVVVSCAGASVVGVGSGLDSDMVAGCGSGVFFKYVVCLW